MALTSSNKSGVTAALIGVRVRADDLARAVIAYEAVIGVKAQLSSDGWVLYFDQTRIVLTDGSVPDVAMRDGKPRVGIWGVDVALADPKPVFAALAAQGYPVTSAVTESDQAGYVDQNGVRVFLSTLSSRPAPAPKADVALDHVALLVGDFDAPTKFWETLTGMPSHRIDVHPISNGTFGAVRFLLGACMIELVVPLTGTTSMLATRLATLGEGPATLALPAHDLGAKRAQLSADGISIVERPPHWFVRPAEMAGVLLQLTPRVDH